jgi:cell wall-associated NlpC family hydrolase
MTKDEALMLALGGLEKIATVNAMDYEYQKWARETLPAIKQALEQEKALQALHNENERLGLYKDAYGQPEQEPVAWRNAALRVGEDLCSVGPFGYYDMTAEQWLDWALSVVTVHAPTPKREPLTDEEMKKIWYSMQNIMGWYSFEEIARAIEAAHGIKGDEK